MGDIPSPHIPCSPRRGVHRARCPRALPRLPYLAIIDTSPAYHLRPAALLAVFAQFLLERFVRAWRLDRRAVCAGAATDLALIVQEEASLPIEIEWTERYARLPRICRVRIRGRRDRFLSQTGSIWSARTVTRVFGALMAIGIRIQVAFLRRIGDMDAVQSRATTSAAATGPP